jgi:hypothetical protein
MRSQNPGIQKHIYGTFARPGKTIWSVERSPKQMKTLRAGITAAIRWTARYREHDEGIWLVSFMDYDLGYIDLEEKTYSP